MSKSRIVIGDVHGCYYTLLKLLEKLPKGVPVTFAGDLIDRGPMSRHIVELIQQEGYDCVRGNHEQMMIDEIEKCNQKSKDKLLFNQYGIWLMNGGRQCIESYKNISVDWTEAQEPIFELNKDRMREDAEWMKQLPLYIKYKDIKDKEGKYLVVSHASVSQVWDWPKEKIEDKKDIFENSIMWNRNSPKETKDKIFNIFGHTPVENPIIRNIYANVDTGACFKDVYGKLTAIQFPEMKVYQQENIDD